ncbi:unnamed protein product [Didymodactylos carnosus]|uniref:Uncharacterized protein n=1 Tax=Didymodactylos carnosus TaxID=1234261 RepID=A0A815CIH2_9BILA|nr:unnamed protein product [Didymodactylos carnosus]CAF1284086.1 unnamed protein product [Didymodactylos carnosus]CAF3652532.1 unnamed protein product [Didymodactylos carnosus]CAF4082119.1 unnamed protein product [Didymodactylos carnosus]
MKLRKAGIYDKNEGVRPWLSFMAVPLITHDAVDDDLELLIDSISLPDNLLVEFFQYFEKQRVTRILAKYWNLGPVHLRCNNAAGGEESLVMMRTTQMRSGNYHVKTMPFSLNNKRARKKTKQLKNLSRLYEIGAIYLKQYITNLSFVVGKSTTVITRKKEATR